MSPGDPASESGAIRGASDAADAAALPIATTAVATKIRHKVRSGLLPLPPEKCYVGKGTRRACDGCDEVIMPEEIEYELDITESRTVRFHEACLKAWHAARAERMAD